MVKGIEKTQMAISANHDKLSEIQQREQQKMLEQMQRENEDNN